jgi:hypothetical protein
MPISVIPNLSRRTCPEISCHFSSVLTGRAADPDIMTRILLQASDIFWRSIGDDFCQASISFI